MRRVEDDPGNPARSLERGETPTTDDMSLLELWRKGDQASGQTLFRRHFRDVYRFLEHKAPDEADDLVQRTFAACVVAKDQFRGEASFRTFLFAIARKQLYTHLRQQHKGKHIDFEVTSISDLVTSLTSKLGRANEIEQLRIALSHLPAEQQLLLELHYWHDLDASALAEVFEIAPGTIRVRLLRARNALRKQLTTVAADIGLSTSGDSLVAALSRPEDHDESS
jgi:RNA polymerase sigma-70 factor (ECF subfamily)